MSAAKSNNIPTEYRPLSAWAYFGYNILYSVPLLGLIFMVVFALDSSNINRRNFTRSFFIVYLLYGILIITMVATGALLGIAENFVNNN